MSRLLFFVFRFESTYACTTLLPLSIDLESRLNLTLTLFNLLPG